MGEDKLIPCSVCGGEHMYFLSNKSLTYAVKCPDCGSYFGLVENTKEDYIQDESNKCVRLPKAEKREAKIDLTK